MGTGATDGVSSVSELSNVSVQCPHIEDHASSVSRLSSVSVLRARIEEYHQKQARRFGWVRRFIPTGLDPLDAALPGGGVPRGVIVEVLSHAPGTGALSLAMRIARACGHAADDAQYVSCDGQPSPRDRQPLPFDMRDPPFGVRGFSCPHKPLVIVDTRDDFYPPALCAYGLSLERLIVIRTKHAGNALWATEQSLRCPALGAVVAPLTGLTGRDSRRLQLAAESTGCVGLILRPARERIKSFAAVRLLIEGVPSDDDRYLCDVHVLTVREGMPAGPLRVDVNHETGTGFVHPLPVDRSAAKTG